MMQPERTRSPLRNTGAVALSTALWIVSLILAMFSTFALRDIFIWGLAALITPSDQAGRLRAASTINFAQDCALVVFGVISIVVIVISSEYFFREVGQTRLLRRQIRIIVAECVIVLPVALILWR